MNIFIWKDESLPLLQLLEGKNGLALVDTGFGVTEVRNPMIPQH